LNNKYNTSKSIKSIIKKLLKILKLKSKNNNKMIMIQEQYFRINGLLSQVIN